MRNGSGVYTLPSNSWNPAVSNTQISATDWNSTATDLATAITQSICVDGQTTCTGSIPFAQGINVSNGGLKSYDAGGTYSLAIKTSSTFSANRIVTINPSNANRTIALAGNITAAGSITTSGAYPLTLTLTAATNVTLPTSGTLLSTGSPSGYVSSITGTSGEITASDGTGAVTLSFPTSMTHTGNFTMTKNGADSAAAFVAVGSGIGQVAGYAWNFSTSIADSGHWSMTSGNTGLLLNTYSDAGAVGKTAMLIGRSGTTPADWTVRTRTTFSVQDTTAANNIFQVDASASSVATGIKVTGAAAAAGAAVSVLSTGTNENLTIDAKGSGTITLGGTSTGGIVLSRALTYGGVTLSNAVTGTGNMVLSASPTITGTLTAAAANFSGNVGVGGNSFAVANFNTLSLNPDTTGSVINFMRSGSANAQIYETATSFNMGSAGAIVTNIRVGGSVAIAVNSVGGIQFLGYGAGAATFDASGNITSVSDETQKHIIGPYLATVDALKPIIYKWREESGMETEHEYAGFSAQNCNAADPLMTGRTGAGLMTLQDRAVLAAAVNSIRNNKARIEALEARIAELEGG